MHAFYGDRISPHMARLPDGALLCRGVPICRTGKQIYRVEELADFTGRLPKGVTARNGMVEVNRPEEEVLSARTMASFEGAPVTGPGHPPQFVTPSNWRAWASGHAQFVRPGPTLRNGDKTLCADLLIRDAPLAEQIENGTVRQISCGYDTEYQPEDDGTFTQRNIIGNHISVLKAGRAGEAIAIQDHAVQMYTVEDCLERFGLVLARAYELPHLRPVVDELFAEWAEDEVRQVMDARADDAADYAQQMRKFHRRAL
jgi:hypothetical protein